MNNRVVHITHPPRPPRERVVIYCRVSTATEAQIHSLLNQIRFLTGIVVDNPEWELTNVYVDVKSGSSSSGREDLNRMMNDARNHAFDILLVKSCSRFFRNVVEALTLLHELQDLGIIIRFDEENLVSTESNFWPFVNIAQIAAEHLNSVRSENIKWGIKRSAQDGTSPIFDRKCYGYTNDEDGRLIPNPDEAPIVQLIFKLYLDGYSIVKIIQELQTRKILSPTGNEKWCKHTLEVMLTNVKYVGDSAVLKTTSTGYAVKKRVKTDTMLLAPDDHEPIISRETFAKVQEERARRSNVVRDENGSHRSSKKYSAKSSIKQTEGVNT